MPVVIGHIAIIFIPREGIYSEEAALERAVCKQISRDCLKNSRCREKLYPEQSP